MGPPRTCTLEEARQAKPRARAVFAPLGDVVGIGVTRIGDGYGLKVNLEARLPTDTAVPTDVDGVPVRVEVVGKPRAQ
jgi:hypothetical protein